MGKLTGFLNYERLLAKDISPEKRLKNWEEFHQELPLEKLKTQGARCMDCGIPYCHMGLMLNNLTSGCPLNNLIPEFNDLVYHNRFEDAYLRLKKTNNFPEFTGRVCPAPCEGSCTVGLNQEPVTIKNIEWQIIENAFKEGLVKPTPPMRRTGKSVAIIGSGPAGLACADELNKLGHKVTVYERADRIGGLLMYGIPNMKLDKKIIVRRLEIMQKEGITFITKTEVGKDISAKKLQQKFDALVLCCGATKPRDLQVEGRSLKGVYFAMDFLGANTKHILDSKSANQNYISAKNKNVIVIGGGDTGTDCVGTSLRHGAKSVIQLEILPKPALERDIVTNPWPEWPKFLKTDYGQEEAIEIFGKDPREYCQLAKKIIGNKNNEVTSMETREVKWEKNAKGNFIPKEIPDTTKTRPADLILLAMGFTGPEETLVKDLQLEQDARTNVKANFGQFQTNAKGVFTAGDMRRGQSLVVWAIAEGRGAASACHKFLSL